MVNHAPAQNVEAEMEAADHQQATHHSPSDNHVGSDGLDDELESEEEMMDVTIQFHGKPTSLRIPATLTVSQLSTAITSSLSIDADKQKLMIAPKPGLLKHPFPDTPLRELLTPRTKITLFGSTSTEINALDAAIARPNRPRTITSAAPSKYRDWKKVQEESIYTFHAIRPLPYLPDPERSRRFLERLAQDPGIKASMRKHRFSVGLLTEMNPVEHTTHEGMTLGLNRNRGEVIELRLRTDRYDGYRDYKVIRKTLCHELSHNVWGEHDRNFWDLTHQIEKEVEAGDWKHGGHQVQQGEFYNPDDRGEGVHFDHGGWTGGEFILGSEGASHNEGLTRREILARAALSRQEKMTNARERLSDKEGEHKDTRRSSPDTHDRP